MVGLQMIGTNLNQNLIQLTWCKRTWLFD